MLSMSKLRQHSKKMYWFLLIAFLGSIVFMGLMGPGTSIIASIFGEANPKLNNVGQIGGTSVTDTNYDYLVSNQLNSLRLQNGNITAQDSVNVYNSVWNTLVQHQIEEDKAIELGLVIPDSLLFNQLRNSPPRNFQQIFTSEGLFIDDNGNFDIEEYQNVLDSKSMPDDFKAYFDQWGPIVEKYILSPQMLRDIYSRASTVSNQEIKLEYLKGDSIDIDYIFIKTNTISNDLIEVSNQEINAEYNKVKNDKYKLPKRRTIDYISFEITNSNNMDLVDSLNEVAYSFIDEADLTSFKSTAEKFDYSINSLDIHEGFDNNSGFPFLMGTSRAAVRFIFDSEIGSISEPVKMNNQLIVFKIIKEKNAGYTPLNEVEENIKKSLIKDKKTQYAADILNQLDWPNTDFNNPEIQIMKNQKGTVNGRFDEIGTSSELTGTLLGLEAGQTSNIVNTYNTVCRVTVNSKDSFNQSKYEEAYTSLKNKLTNSKNNSNYQLWFNDAKDNCDIEDYRSEKY